MNTELQAAVRRLEAVAEGGLVPMPDDSEASLESDIATVLAALSTPPADDLRTILEYIAETACESGDAVWVSEAREIAEAMLTDPRIEVRPRGTVTDAEVEAAVEAFWKADDPTGGPVSMRAALEAAREARS